MGCWMKLNSYWPIQRTMKCRYCHNLEWRGDMSVSRMKLVGCYKCRIKLEPNVNDNDCRELKIRKKVYHCITTGRYS